MRAPRRWKSFDRATFEHAENGRLVELTNDRDNALPLKTPLVGARICPAPTYHPNAEVVAEGGREFTYNVDLSQPPPGERSSDSATQPSMAGRAHACDRAR